MAHEYTTGLPKPQETLLAEALIERISALHVQRGMFLKHVGEVPTMPTRLGGGEFDSLVNKLRTRAPAVVVAIDGSRPRPGGMTNERNRWSREFSVAIGVFSTHRRDLIGGRLNSDAVSAADDQADPGIRAISELIDQLLLGWPLPIETFYEVAPAEQGIQTIFTENGGTLREMQYRVLADRQRDPWPDMDAFLSSVRATYEQPDGAALIQADSEVKA